MERRLRSLVLLVACCAVAGCWESKRPIFDHADYHLRDKHEVITISDRYGPLGLHATNSENQYVPLFTEAKPNTTEFPFRKFRIGMVPVDRMLDDAQLKSQAADSRHSRALLPDTEALLYVLVLEADEVDGQAFALGFVEGEQLSICPDVLQISTPLHDRFKAFVQAGGAAADKKRGVTNLILERAKAAQQQGKLECQDYRIETHKGDDFVPILKAIERGDTLRRGPIPTVSPMPGRR